MISSAATCPPRTQIDPARLIAATYAPGRFRGRAELIKLAKYDSTAVRALELDAREREFAALRDEFSDAVTKALALPSVEARDRLRQERRALAASGVDPIDTRLPGRAIKRATMLAFRDALRAARFRKATHGHTQEITYVERGKETADSATEQERPSKVGLPNAYAKHAFWVTLSAHSYRVSAAILRVPRAERAQSGVLYLSPDCRVRQGRGTSLVVERRAGERGGWR